MWRLLVHLNTPPQNKWKLHLSKVDSSWTKLNVGLWRKKWWRKIDEEKIAEEKLVTWLQTNCKQSWTFIYNFHSSYYSLQLHFIYDQQVYFLYNLLHWSTFLFLSICPFLYRPRPRAIRPHLYATSVFFSGIVYSVSPQLWQIDSFFRGFVQ